jgi:hypothetical protein
VRSDIQREMELADLKRLQEEAQKATAAIDASVRGVADSLQDAAREAAAGEGTAAASPPAPDWPAASWASHRFRTRARPDPSLSDLAEAVEQLRGRASLPAGGRIGRNRHAPRSRVNRPRIYR